MNQVSLLKFNHLSHFTGLSHFVTTRAGGVSMGEYASLNLGKTAGDHPENIKRNHQILAESVSVSPEKLFFPQQVHGDKISLVNEETKTEDLQATDALITETQGVCIGVLAADCTPLLFFDPKTQSAGVAHAGWRGTVQKIGVKTVQAMQTTFGARLSDICVGIGPAVSAAVYEVGGDVIDAVRESLPRHYKTLLLSHQSPEKAYFDLWEANRLALLEVGVREENIEVMRRCTFSDERFFSARRQGIKSGRFGAGIMLRSE